MEGLETQEARESRRHGLAARLRALPTALERASGLDGLADRVARLARPIETRQRLRDVLHGVWLGHPLHPALVQVPTAAWLGGVVLDTLPGYRRAATGLVTVGTASAVPAAAAGLNDWLSLSREQRRVGLVHATGNLLAWGLFASSVAARLTGRHGAGRTLARLGLLSASAGAYLGAHLAYSQAAGVNMARPDLTMFGREGWTDLGAVDEFTEGDLALRAVGSVPLVVHREGDTFSVLLDHCAHHRGPLAEGEIRYIDGAACVTCPWHGSTVRLSDGQVVHGPAATAQPTLRTRTEEGRLQVLVEA